MNIILLAGFSAAGKSTLASKLAEKGLHQLKHQEVVHAIAVEKGYERARHWLADVGQAEFMRTSLNKMIEEVKFYPEGSVVDVVYGKEMVTEMKSQIPNAKILVIFVDVDEKKRLERIMIRMGEPMVEVAQKELDFRDKFLLEAGVEELKQTSDLIVDDSENLIEVVKRIWARLL